MYICVWYYICIAKARVSLPDEVIEPVVVAAGTDWAHALDFVEVHVAVADVVAMAEDVHVPHPEAAAQAMVVTGLSTIAMARQAKKKKNKKKKKGMDGVFEYPWITWHNLWLFGILNFLS